MSHWNGMTYGEQVDKLPKLVSILGNGGSIVFREVLAEMLADIATCPADLLLLMKPTLQSKLAFPKRLIKLLEQAEAKIRARASKMSGWLSALLLKNGIMPDRIISLRTDAPGVAIQVGNDESNQALIVCEGGEWRVHIRGPRLPNGCMVHFESAEAAVRVVAGFSAASFCG